jgi:hypothetical protein
MPDLNPQRAFKLAGSRSYWTYDNALKDLGYTPRPLLESMKRIAESLDRSA